ncbi:response regulator [Candidatus Bipolaricaulota bacterium]|nr:response regulator [Candidatus Bipolaricaulota bacterium]
MSKPRRVLVVDDDKETVDMLTAILESASYRVLAAHDGREGVARAKSEKPDAVILDLMMPEMDGFAACHEMKIDAETRGIPILVLTGIGQQLSHSRYAKEKGLGLESEDYIEKPIDSAVLLERLADLLA